MKKRRPERRDQASFWTRFSGSGTTVSQAIKYGRKFIACDLRESEIKKTQRRIKQAKVKKGFGLVK